MINALRNLVWLFIAFTFLGYSCSVNAEQNQEANKKNDNDKLVLVEKAKPEVFIVNTDILSIIPLSESNKESTKQELRALIKPEREFNLAEQYLLLVIKANIVDSNEEVIELLSEAVALETGLSKTQLNSPVFAKAYKQLALAYENQKNYEQAYEVRKKYIRKYFSHLKQQKNMRVKRLSEKYQVEKKYEENELLEQTNKLKQLALEKAESEVNEQYRNIVLMTILGIVFLFLLFRQFSVKRTLTYRRKRDKLTQLINRREFFIAGKSATSYALTHKQKLCVIIIDIDNVKNINDTHGRDIADNVIKCVANFSSETMRSRDILARFGGEEFAAILPEATIEEARAMAVRIREKIQIKSANQLETKVDVTVSIGIASIEDINGNFDSLIGAAGIALHHAQMNGYNQVCNYPINVKNR